MQTFDALPCFEATIEDLDIDLFRQRYLPLAFPEEVLKKDSRKVEHQLQALGFFNVKYNCPTFAGVIMFGKKPERFLPGCYVQYVKFAGKGRAGKILSEYKFSGNLMNILYELDTFVKTTITNRRPVPVSALREEMVYDYPHWATRELLMNSVCHRDYEGNGPVQFYQYDDRLEILNPGGLYGKATPENFPYVNDYRNGVIAEAMKVLGFVNRYSRGVQAVQEELKANGNPEAEFQLHLRTAFLVVEHLAAQSSQNTIQNTKTPSEVEFWARFEAMFGEKTKQLVDILIYIKHHPNAMYGVLHKHFSIGTTTVYRYMSRLQETGVIRREGSKRDGKWTIIPLYDSIIDKYLEEHPENAHQQ